MESLFNFTDYRAYLTARIKAYPKNGYGVLGKLAEFIGVHPSLLSQIFKGEKSLTQDQAIAAAEFFGLTEIECEYFLLLVQIDRAGTPKLKSHLEKKLREAKEKASRLVNRLSAQRVLSEESKGIFYSNWIYTACRQLTAIDEFRTPETIAERLNLPLKDVRKVLEFLINEGLCVEENGTYRIGPKSTHLPDTSPWVTVHHRNWRQRAMEQMGQESPDSLYFTCPLTLSKEDIPKVRELIVKFIDEVYKVVDPSPSEELCCLNIDWFRA